MIKRILCILIIVSALLVLQVIGLADVKGISYGVSTLYVLLAWFIGMVTGCILMFAIYLIREG